MKRIFIMLIVGAMMMAFSTSGWTQAPFHLVDTTLKAINSSGVATYSTNTVTIKVVLINDSTLTSTSRLGYYGIDTATGIGIYIFGASGSDTTYPGLLTTPPPGARKGTYLQIQGNISQFGGNIEFVPDTTFPAVVLGTGYAIPTTVMPSLSAFMGFDTTEQTGEWYYGNGRLVRVNNVHFVPPYAASFSNGNFWIVDGSLPILGQSSVNLFIPTASGNNLTAQSSTLYTQITSGSIGSFDYIGPCTVNSASNLSTGGEFFSRGLVSDFIPHYFVTPAGPLFTQPGGASNQLIVAGGFPPYTWSLSTTTTGKGSLNTTSGATVTYSPGSTVGTLQVVVTDSAGEQLAITVSITGTSAPMAPDISMESMAVPMENNKAVIKPTE